VQHWHKRKRETRMSWDGQWNCLVGTAERALVIMGIDRNEKQKPQHQSLFFLCHNELIGFVSMRCRSPSFPPHAPLTSSPVVASPHDPMRYSIVFQGTTSPRAGHDRPTRRSLCPIHFAISGIELPDHMQPPPFDHAELVIIHSILNSSDICFHSFAFSV
jgi:hypothetical protein